MFIPIMYFALPFKSIRYRLENSHCLYDLHFLQLVLDWGISLAVLVRCFADKTGIEKQIVNKLGSGFSRAPFAVVVVNLF